MSDVLLSVVVPVFNEQDNINALCEQIVSALDSQCLFEVVLVDDGSTDETRSVFAKVDRSSTQIRMVHHPVNLGQSSGLCTGVLAARGELIVTIDGDLQNDPEDIPKLMRILADQEEGKHYLIAGNRTKRKDTRFKRFSSRVANAVRSRLLRDHCPDTGCSLKLFRRDDFLLLPQFNHMHRYLPALFARIGVQIVNVPVNHRARVAGVSKYGLGNRLWVGIMDILGVRWLNKRSTGIRAVQLKAILDEHRGENHE